MGPSGGEHGGKDVVHGVAVRGGGQDGTESVGDLCEEEGQWEGAVEDHWGGVGEDQGGGGQGDHGVGGVGDGGGRGR